MKKISLLLIAFSLLFASCGKDSEKEWDRFYGFTQADVIGHYEANPDESLYEPLPNNLVTVFSNATMDIMASGSASVALHIIIPDQINKSFTGSISSSDEGYSDLVLYNYGEDIMMTVYKNSTGQVRLHGRVKHYAPENNPYISDQNWGFDVIKQE